ncbi:MAG: sigma-70 family RNA polymerase sigma factor [Chloroflexi bacterium]|nr:sigma-70 family RNA polymerase sigma factor [Chloroflexota bacterium]
MVSEALGLAGWRLPSLALAGKGDTPNDGVLEPDEVWVERARRHPDAFAELVRRFQSRIYSLTYRMTGNREDARDLTQDAFIRAYDGLSTFRPNGRFSPWLYRIAVNLCLNHLRRRREETDLGEIEYSLRSGTLEEVVENREMEKTVARAILSMPTHYRSPLLLRHISGLSYEEMTQVLDMPLGTVKTRLHRARELLSARLRLEGVEGIG